MRFMLLALAACQSTGIAQWISTQRFQHGQQEAANITFQPPAAQS
jgi:hypothetical protein